MPTDENDTKRAGEEETSPTKILNPATGIKRVPIGKDDKLR
jgi:hypothetical protein